MELDWAVLADKAYHRDGKLSVEGIFWELETNRVPLNLAEKYLVLMFKGTTLEKGISYPLTLTVMDADGRPVWEELSFAIEFPNSLQGWDLHLTQIVELQGVELPGLGSYSFNIATKDKLLGQVSLQVVPLPDYSIAP